MATNNEDIKWLYGKLKGHGYNIGTEDEFTSSLANDNDRQWYYEKGKGMGLNLGSKDDFNSLFAPEVESAGQLPATDKLDNSDKSNKSDKSGETEVSEGWQPTEQEKIRMSAELNGIVSGFNQRIKARVDQSKRMGMTTTPEGRREVEAGKFSARLAGQPTELPGLTPAVSVETDKSDKSDNSDNSVEPGMQSIQSPVPYGVKIVDGKRVTEWMLPDGSLTTDLGEADRAERMAGQARVQHEFERRMKKNGLDPTKPADVERQKERDMISSILSPMEQGQVAESLWQEAEEKHKADVEASSKKHWDNYVALGMAGGREMRYVTAASDNHDKMVSRMTRFDLQEMMDSAWERVGGQMTEKCFNILQKSNPEASEAELRQAATEWAHQLSDKHIYDYAVKKNTPKSTLDYFGRMAGDMNVMASISKGLARSKAGTTGDMAAYEQAMGDYGKKHRVAQVGGMVFGMGIDPVTWVSGGVGSMAGKGAVNLGGRFFGRGFSTTLGGRILGSAVGAAGNLATYEGLKEAESQFVHGGHINPKTGENEGYSAGEILKSTGHGVVMGSVIGPLSPVIGNVADKAVKATTSTAGKVALRGSEVAVSTLAEGTIFSVPQWVSGEGDAFDVWTDNMAMMLGFKAQHSIKSAPRVIAELRPIREPKTQADRVHNKKSFIERVHKALDPADFSTLTSAESHRMQEALRFSKDEIEELRAAGYGELSDLFKRDKVRNEQKPAVDPEDGALELSAERVEAEEVSNGRPDIDGYSEVERLVQDRRVSQAVRAKAYYIVAERMLPMGTVAGWTTTKEADGRVTVKAVTADGEVVTSRSFANEKESEHEINNIRRQAELNSVDVGERYAEANADDMVLSAAVNEVSSGADSETVKRIYRAVKAGNKEVTDEQVQLVSQIDEAIERNKNLADSHRPEAIREAIKEDMGIDVDDVLRKSVEQRSETEQEAVKTYLERLFPEEARKKAEEPTAQEAKAQERYEQGRELFGRYEDSDPHAQAEVDDIAKRMEEAYQGIEDAFGGDAESCLALLEENPWGLLNDPELSIDQQDAVLNYINSKAALDGVMDASNESAERKRREIEQTIKKRMHKDSGIIIPATMKVDDRPVYIVKGDVAMHADGSGIDAKNSSESIIIMDAESGEYEFTSPEQIYQVGERIDPQEEQRAAIEAIEAERAGIFSGRETSAHSEEWQRGYDNAQDIREADDERLQSYFDMFEKAERESAPIMNDDVIRGRYQAIKDEMAKRNGVNGESLKSQEKDVTLQHGNGPEQDNGVGVGPEGSNAGIGMATDSASGVEGDRDRSDIRVYEEGLGTSHNAHSDDSERDRREAESERLVEISRKEGHYRRREDIAALGKRQRTQSGESEVYVDQSNGRVYKVKNPYAKSPMKGHVQPEDAIYEHLVHNKYFPETRYKFEGISEDMGDARIVLSQGYVESVGQATKEQIEAALAERGLLPEGQYRYGNDEISVTDVTGDNALLGADGKVYFIDPIIDFKKPVREILGDASEQSEQSETSKPSDGYLSRIPRNEKGKPVFEQAETAEVGWDALVEHHKGDSSKAQVTADIMVENKRKALDKVKKLKPKGNDPDEILESQEEIATQLAQAEQEYNSWQEIAAVEQGRQQAIAERQEAERMVQAEQAKREADLAKQEAEEANANRPAVYRRVMERWDEPLSVREYMLRQIAGGGVKFRWSDSENSRTHGIGKHITGGDNLTKRWRGDSEYGSRRWMIDDKEGLFPEEYAERVCQDFYNDYEQDTDHSQEVFGELLDILLSRPTSKSMYDEARELHAVHDTRRYTEDELMKMEHFGTDTPEEADFIDTYGMTYHEYESEMEAFEASMEEKHLSESEYSELMRNFAEQQIKEENETELSRENQVDDEGGIPGIREGGDGLLRAEWSADGGRVRGASEGTGPERSGHDGVPENGSAQAAPTREASSGNPRPAHERSKGEVDEHGSPFIFNNDGSTIFGEITDESGLTPAPIKLSKGFHDEITGKGYGLLHIETNHGEQIRQAGFNTVQEFVSFVAKNYDIDNIRIGKRRDDGNETFLIQVTDRHENTLYIELSKDGTYWGVNSGGVFRRGYAHKKETVAKTEPQQPNNAVSTGPSLSEDEIIGITSTEPNGEPTVSEGKGSENFSNKQISGSEPSEQSEGSEPSEAQKRAGNYKMEHRRIDGYNISIENPKGSVRRGKDADGKEWQTEMHHDYGYIRGTEGVDGDHIDVFLSDTPEDGDVFVIDQRNEDGSFDEHKVMYGFPTEEAAREAYLSNYEQGWKGLGAITQVSKDEFKKWVQSSKRKTKPFAEYKSVKAKSAQSESSEQSGSSTQNPQLGITLEGHSDFGPVFTQFKGNAPGAIKMLSELQTGEAIGALHHKDIGDIDLVWGNAGTAKSDGFGLAKLVEYHPEVVDKLQDILDDMHIVKRSDNRINLESDTHKATVRLTWNNEKKQWLLTAFEKKETPESIGKTTDTDDNPLDLRGDTTLSQNSGVSEGKGSENFTNKQISEERTPKKIEDFGEKLLGARKDMLGVLAKTIENATVQSLIELPLSKAFKRPNLKNMVDQGAIGEDEALLAEAVMQSLIYGSNKPKSTGRASRKREISQWAEDTYQGIHLLGEILSGDETRKEKALAEHKQQLAKKAEGVNEHIRKLREWNPGQTFNDVETLPDPIEVMARVLQGINYRPGEKLDLPLSRIENSSTFQSFIVSSAGKQEALWFKRSHRNIDDAINTMILAAKLSRGDMDVELPQDFFMVRGKGDSRNESTGKFDVRYTDRKGNCRSKEFNTEDAAKEFATKNNGKVYPQLRRTVEYDSYVMTVKNPLTGNRHNIGEPFTTREEVTAWHEANREGANTQALEAINKEMGVKGKQREHFYVSSSWDGKAGRYVYSVIENDRNNPWPILKDFLSRKEAEEWLKSNKERLDAERKAKRDAERKIVYFESANGVRKGRDWRKGQAATPEMFGEAFGFRGVQFGNWTNDADRQAALNEAYDALMDMSAALGITSKALSLDGELGLAFGARGGGKASAHYEPVEVVINLTKTRGAGSLAHEWWHAVDNFLARMSGVPLGYVSHDNGVDKLNGKVADAVQSLMTIVNNSNYSKRSRDKGDYWGRGTEQMARLFESWIANKLTGEGIHTPFLADVPSEKAKALYQRLNYLAYKSNEARVAEREKRPTADMPFEEFAKRPESLRGYPYPTREEIETFNPLLEGLFNVLSEREHDSGSIAMERGGRYKRSQSTMAGRSLFEWLDESKQAPEADLVEAKAAETANRSIDDYAEAYKRYLEESESLEGELSKLPESSDERTDLQERLSYEEAMVIEGRRQLEENLREYYVRNNTPEDAEKIAGDMVARVQAEVEIRRRQDSFLRDMLTPVEELKVPGDKPVMSEEASKSEVKTAGGYISYESLGHLPNPAKGEFSYVERQFSRSGEFTFTGNEHIKDGGDVAYIFRSLEDYSIENVFAVFQKGDAVKIVHIGMGGPTASFANMNAIRSGYDAFGADKVYLVHNHPSGILKPSKADNSLMKQLEKAFEGSGVETEGLILDTTSGRYVVFNGAGDHQQKERPQRGGDIAASVYRFDRAERTHKGSQEEYVHSSDDIARYLEERRLGTGDKVSYLVLSNSLEVIGNFHTDFKRLSDDGLAEEIASVATKYGGTRVVVYGNTDLNEVYPLNDKVARKSLDSIHLLDAIKISEGLNVSAVDEGLFGEPASAYGKNEDSGMLSEPESARNPISGFEQSEELEQSEDSKYLSEMQADELVSRMEDNAEVAPVIKLTPENWTEQFGEDSMVVTPIGTVKMGDNQYAKMDKRGRAAYFGMIKPTLTRPDIIIEKNAPVENAERDTKYLFIKTFVKPDGSRVVHFESITIQRDGMEVSISSHEAEGKAIKKEMQNGKILHLSKKLSLGSEGYLTEAPKESEGPDLVPTSDNIISGGKGTKKSGEMQGRTLNSLAEDGEAKSTGADGNRYRLVEDKELLDFLDGQPLKLGYRYAQWANMGVLPPMTAKQNGEWRAPMVFSRWEQSEEGMRKDNGKADLVQGNGRTTGDVAYNPYFHIRTAPLNDQFTAGYDRPELLIVAGYYPESEETSGYHADGAKDSVGLMDWHSGSVNGQLSDDTKVQTMLSRYFKPVRIVPWSEAADLIMKRVGDQRITFPINSVPPMLRAELAKRGAKFGDISGSVAEADIPMLNDLRDRVNAGEWDAGLERAREYMDAYESSSEAKEARVENLSRSLHTPIRVISDQAEIDSLPTRRKRGAKGWWSSSDNGVVVVLPNNVNVADVDNTVVHEVVGHKGLRALIGAERFNEFLNEIYDHASDSIRKRIVQMTDRLVDDEVARLRERKRVAHERAGEDVNAHYYSDMAEARTETEAKREQFRREATEEYMADLSGRIGSEGFEKMSRDELTFWGKIKAKVQQFLDKFLQGLKIPKSIRLNDKHLSYILYMSLKNLRNKWSFAEAEDAVRRRQSGYDADDVTRYRDPDMGLEETITRMKAEAMQANTDNLEAKQTAMRAIGGNLNHLRQAMSRQKEYDITTVKSVSDLARVLMDAGLLDDLSKYETKRILGAINNVVGKQDVSQYVQKVMDIMVDNQLRLGANTLGRLLSIRGSRVDARGIEVQGELDPDGQRIAQVVRKSTSLPKDDIDNRIADAMNRMGSSDNTIADEATIEYAGLQIARQYVEDITESKAEEKELRDSIKQAQDEYRSQANGTGDTGWTKESLREYISSTEDAIRQNKIDRAEAFHSLVEQVGNVMSGSIERAKAWREAEKQRVEEIHHNANSDMEGRPTDEHHKDDCTQKIVNNSFARFLLAPLATFDQMLRMFGKKNTRGEGYLWNRYMRGWVEASENEYTGYQRSLKVLDEKVSEVFGKKMTWGDLFSLDRNLRTASVAFWDGGEMKEHELTQGNLLYIYMADKMSDGRMKLRRMGVTEEDITRIKEFIDPRFIELADWMQDEFLVDKRNEYNEVHKRMFGASMAAIENYFPLKILANARMEDVDVADDTTDDVLPSTSTGSIIKRRRNNLALDVTGANAFSVILDHLQQMERWAAFAEFNRDLNTLLSYKRFRNQVMNMSSVYGAGKTLWNNFRNVCSMAAGAYRPPIAALDKSAVNIAKGVTAAKVSFRLFTSLKQFLSMPAYISDSSPKYLVANIANPMGAWKWSMENLPLFEKRWKSRMAGDPRLLKTEMDWKMWRSRVVEIASRVGMSPNAFVDALTVSIGAHSMYQTKLAEYKRMGYPEELAEKRAKQDATILVNQTQQSSESAFLSTMQVDRSWLSVLFTVFRNSSMSYTRQLYDAIRNISHRLTPGYKGLSEEFMSKQMRRDGIDPEQADRNAKRAYRRGIIRDVVRVGVFGYVLQLAWNLGAYLPYLFLGDDDEEKEKMMDDVFTHTMFGSIEGLTGGDIMSSAGNILISGEGNPAYLTKDMPLASDVLSILKKMDKDQVSAMNDVINLCVQSGLGVNPQSLTDAVTAVIDYCGDDAETSRECALLMARVFNCPQSQIDKIYLDEIDATAKEASRMTPSEIAERYARYKVMRGAPLTGWAYGSEQREKLMEKYRDRINAPAKEKFIKATDEKASPKMEELLREYEQTKSRITEIKKDREEDEDRYYDLLDTLYESPEYERYLIVKDYKQHIDTLTKEWLRAETPAKLDSCAKSMVGLKRKMYEDWHAAQ